MLSIQATICLYLNIFKWYLDYVYNVYVTRNKKILRTKLGFS